ncbi:MAG: fibronectin type III domain-containing protein [Bacteroidales bacterium]|jgi:hypothetical protein|nr:fibronectin type III domain-containing protein [Bacteroidales bacterium]
MKKYIITAILGSLIFYGTISAQVIHGYSFESSAGVYSEITGGTVVWSGADTDNNTLTELVFYSPTEKSKELVTDVAGIPIGFDFDYDNQTMNRFAISSYGAIILGKDKVTANTNPASLLGTANSSETTYWKAGDIDVIGTIKQGFPFEVYASANTEISYKVEGTNSNRILVVQFKKVQLALTNDASQRTDINHQIRLYEGSNKIEFVYNGWSNSAAASSLQFCVGLKGSSPGNVHLRISSWSESSKAAELPGIHIQDTRITGSVSDGLTFTFTPPANCSAPSGQPTDLTFDPPTSTGISGRFTATASADHYLTVISESADPVVPQDDRFYAAGDALGNGTVISYSTGNTFASPDNLSSATVWYVHVFAANSYCISGPKYNPVPLTASITTLFGPPAFFVKDVEYDKLTLSVTTGDTGQKVLIASTDEAATKNTTICQYGVFGTPSGTLNVGDEIAEGGVVIYKGDAPGDLVLENLESNTIYHYAAWGWDGDQTYSTNFVTADSITWGKVPDWENGALDYKNFKAFPNFVPLFGGETYGEQGFRLNRYQILECQLSASNAAEANNGFTTQWILLKEGSNRAFIDIQFQEYTSSWSAYNTWDERDSLQISVSEDGITYIPVYTISKEADNVPVSTATSGSDTNTYPQLDFIFTALNGKKVKLKFDWLTYRNARMYIANIKIEERPACLPPLNTVIADKLSLEGDKALIGWTPDGDANTWEIRYRVKGSEWMPSIETNTYPYLLTGLPYRSEIEVQVRSKCSLYSSSPWSKIISFMSGYRLPFSESFDASALPAGWSLEKAQLTSATTTFCNTGKFPCYIYWKVNNQALNINYDEIPGSTNSYQWAKLPVLDFGDGSVNYTFEYELAVTPGTEATPDTDSLLVVVSRNGGKTFSSANVIGRYSILDEETASAVAGKVHRSIALNRYTGVQQLAFYAVGDGKEQIAVDNVGILETCPTVVTNAAASEIGGGRVHITWEGSANEWLVFLRRAGETDKNYQSKTDNEWSLSGLTPSTTYEAGITHSCAEGDTARITIVRFTTSATAPCADVENVEVEATQTSAVISWTSGAANYNIKIRLKNTEDWINRTSQTTSLTLQGLEPDTEYEYSIQAICSPAAGDYSDWTATAVFRTSAITCFPPSGLNIVPAHRSAAVSWEGEADDYEVSYRTGDELWTDILVESAETVRFTGLTPQTAYSFRIRSICAENDTSAWATGSFTTTAIPPCAAPSNLQATGITATSAILSWDADDINLSWDIRYRLASSITYITAVTAWEETNYLLQNLTPATVYIWNIRANCEENIGERWISKEFETDTENGLSDINGGSWSVFASGNAINILNPEGARINRVRLYDLNGVLLEDYTVNTNENVLITTAPQQSVLVVQIDGNGSSVSYKVKN